MIQKLESSYMTRIRRAGYVISLDFITAPLDSCSYVKSCNKPANTLDYPRYSLDIQSPFRFCIDDRVVLGFYELVRHFDVALDDELGNTHFDAVLSYEIEPLLPLKVKKTFLNLHNDICIEFAHNLRFETFINASQKIEHWRLISLESATKSNTKHKDSTHFIIYEVGK